MPSDITVSLTSIPPLKINVPQRGSIEVKNAAYGAGSDATSVKTYGDQTIGGNKTFTGITAGITKSMVDLSNVDNTSDVNKPVSDAAQLVLDGKVDKVVGKVLSDQNYTLTEKDKLAAIVPSKLINGTNEVELGEDANLRLAQNGGIVFDRNNTSINVGMGFHIRSGEGISIEPVDQYDSQNLITRGWYFSTDGSLIAPNNDYYYARSYIVLNTFPAEDSGFGLTTADGVTHDFYYDYDGISGPGTPILVNASVDTVADVVTKTIAVLNNSGLFGDVHWDAELNYIWVYQKVAGKTGNQTNFNYGYTDGVSSFIGAESSKIVFGDGTIQTTAPTSDSYLLDRVNHTGTQSYTTISGLGTLATQDGTFSGTSSGTNTGDETVSTIKSKLDITTLSGANTGDETASSIKSKLGVTTLSGSNTGDQTITLGGDATGSGNSSLTVTLANSGVVAGEYNNGTTAITPFTVDAKGRITATDTPVTITPDWSSIANTPTTLDGYNITDAVNVGETQTISGAKEFILSPIVPRPTESNQAVNKAYADDISAGIHVHAQVHVILTIDLATATGGTVAYTNGTDGVGAKLTVTGGSTIIAALNSACGTDADLVSGENGSRVIINGEADDKNWNGIYVISADRELTRAADFDSSVEMAGGDFVFVTHGTAYADTGWVLSEPVTSVGVSNVEFVQFSGQGSYDAGNGLHRDGTTFSVVGTTGRIVVGPSVDLATYGVAGTYQSVTTDAYGRVTSGSNPTTLSGYGITDAAASSDLSSHVSDDARHLTSTQNTLIDGITVSSAEINRLSGIASNVQTQLDGKSATSHVHSDATTSVAGFMSTGDKTKLNAISGTNSGDETASSIKTKLGITTLSGANTGDQTIALEGDVTGSGTGTFTVALKATGTAGTYNNSATSVRPFTTDSAGRISSVGNAVTITPAWSSITSTPTTLTGYGITDAAALSGAAFTGAISVNSDSSVAISAYSIDARAGSFQSVYGSGLEATSENSTALVGVSSTGIGVEAHSTSNTGLSINSYNGIPLVATKGINNNGYIAQFFSGDANVYSILDSGSLRLASGTSTLTLAAPTVNAFARTITFPAANGTVALASTTLAGYGITDAATATSLSTHIADETKHLTSAQNTLIDAITATSAEINYLGGVSSNIQTQLNSKSATSHTHANATTGIDGFMSAGDKTKLDAITGSNTGDETVTTIKTKLGITTLSGANTGDETSTTIKSALGISTLSGSNTGDQTITLTGDVTGSGTGSFAATLKSVGTAGTYTSVTTDANGRVTAGTNPTTLAGYGITDAADNSNTVIGLSLFL